MTGPKWMIVVAALALAACATARVIPPQGGPAWKDTDANGVPLAKGGDECKYQAKISAASATGISKQEAVAEDFYDSCMRERGY
jgi:hypothetical protein